jgi:hypothetical protein
MLPAQTLPCMGEPGVGRMREGLLLDSGIYRNPFEIFGVDRAAAVGHREALLQQRGEPIHTAIDQLLPNSSRTTGEHAEVSERHRRPRPADLSATGHDLRAIRWFF